MTPSHPQPATGLRLALTWLSLLAVSGCMVQASQSAYPPGPDGSPRPGGKAVFVREEDPDYLDPALSYGLLSAPAMQLIYRTLIEYADAPGAAGAELIPELAEGLPDLRENRTLYCFKVREDARFPEPVNRHITAEDFKYALERLFAVNSPSIPFYMSLQGSDEVVAGETQTLSGVIARGDSLYLRTKAWDPVFLQVFAMPFSAPVPREVAEAHPNDFSQHTVATGPYQVAEFVPRQHLVLIRNPAYCGEPGLLDTVEVRFGVSATNAVAMIRRGLADGGFFDVPPAEIGRLRGDPYWREQLLLADGLNTVMLCMNTQYPPFNDVRVRQAVCWALNRRAFVKIQAGTAVEAGEFLPLGMPGARKLERYQGPDRDKARELLAAAGYPNGLKTKLYGWTISPDTRILAAVQQQLADVGIDAELDLSEVVAYTSFAGDTSNRMPFGIYGWNADYLDPSNFLDVLLNGERITPIQNLNLSMFDDPEVNAAMARASQAADDSVRLALWGQVDEMVMDRAPIAVLTHNLEPRLYSPRLGGWYRHITRIIKLDRVYLKQPAEPGSS